MNSDAAPQPTRQAFGFLIYRLRPPLGKRLRQLLPGLALFGAALALTVEAALGSNPWTVFHEGVADRIGLTIGTIVTLTGLLLTLLFRPLREPLGLGTITNAFGVGLSVDVTLWLVPDLTTLWSRVVAMLIAPPLLGLASGLYIGAGLGPGPRDGLMTALERRGVKVSVARTGIELTALAVGWALGGTVGIGTVWFAATVGYFVRLFLAPLRLPEDLADDPS